MTFQIIYILTMQPFYTIFTNKKFHIAACLCLLLNACSTHYLEIPQGGKIDPENLALLKTGMTKKQVEHLLGSAPIQDPFHKDRWDYIYLLSQGGKASQKKEHLVLYFDGERLQKIQPNNP